MDYFNYNLRRLTQLFRYQPVPPGNHISQYSYQNQISLHNFVKVDKPVIDYKLKVSFFHSQKNELFF